MVNVGNKTNHLKTSPYMANVGNKIKSPYMANVGNKTNHLIWQTLVTKQITLYGKR